MSGSSPVYAECIHETLRREFGPLRNAAKVLGRLAGVTPRTAQNWIDGKNAPQGQALLSLMANNEAIDAEMERLKTLMRKGQP